MVAEDTGGGAAAPGAARDDVPPGGPVARASYVSTPAIIEREARALALAQRSTPRFWRGFVVVRVVVAVAIVAMCATFVATGRVTPVRGLSGAMLFLVVLGLLVALDVWLLRRRLLRAHRAVAAAACPPGTLVCATYTPHEMAFQLPTHRLVLATATVADAVHEGRLLLLRLDDDRVWCVPDELLGRDGLAVLRTVLGPRLREPW